MAKYAKRTLEDADIEIRSQIILNLKKEDVMKSTLLFAVRMSSSSKLLLTKQGGYTLSIKKAKTWKTLNGVVRFLDTKMMLFNPSACWTELPTNP